MFTCVPIYEPRKETYNLSIVISPHHLNLVIDAVIQLEIAGVVGDTVASASLHHLLYDWVVTAQPLANLGRMALVRLADVSFKVLVVLKQTSSS